MDRQATGGKADAGPDRPLHFAESREVVLLHRLLKLTNRLMAPFSTHLSHRHRISLNEFRLLMTIGALGRTASHEVAEVTGVNAMSVSRAVATLERHGRVAVEIDDGNRRRKWLTLTEEGERLHGATQLRRMAASSGDSSRMPTSSFMMPFCRVQNSDSGLIPMGSPIVAW